MGRMRNILGAGVAAAVLATTVTPAMAGSYGSISIGSGWSSHNGGYGLGYGRGWRRHRGHDRVDAGDVIGAIAIIGVIAAVASAASKTKNTTRRDRGDDRYPDRSDRSDDRRNDSGRAGDIRNEEQAVDACATAAEERAGQTASVRDITNVRPSQDGWDVEGVVEQRDGWRDRSADKRRFTCSIRYGSVENVYIESGTVAFR